MQTDTWQIEILFSSLGRNSMTEFHIHITTLHSRPHAAFSHTQYSPISLIPRDVA